MYFDEYDVQHQHQLRDIQLIHYQLNKINYLDNQNHDNHEYDVIQDPIQKREHWSLFYSNKIHTTIRPRGLVSWSCASSFVERCCTVFNKPKPSPDLKENQISFL